MKKASIFAAVLLSTVFLGTMMRPAKADVIDVTFPEVNYASGSYPSPLISWDTETYAIPNGQTITGATISGTWGDTSQFYGSSAETRLFVNGTLVSNTELLSPAPYNNVVPFTYTFADFSSLLTGEATLSFIEDTGNVVRLSDTTLAITTSAINQSPTGAPAPGALALLGVGLFGIGGLRRKMKAA